MYVIRKQVGGEAFGGPGVKPHWASAKKIGVGTARNSYSKVWFTLADGIVTEVYYPTLDRANVRGLQFIIFDGENVDVESCDTHHNLRYIDDRSLAYELINTDKENKYQIIKRVITDPRRNSLILKVRFEVLSENKDDFCLYLYYKPQLDNSGYGDTGYYVKFHDKDVFVTYDANTYSALSTDVKWSAYSTGYEGVNDGLKDLMENREMDFQFDIARNGNIVHMAQLQWNDKNEFKVVLSFGSNEIEALNTCQATLKDDYEKLEQRYIKEWNKYCEKLNDFGGKVTDLYYKSLMVLKCYEDKTYPGAIIASMSMPWGEVSSDDNKAGYHLVWSRDLYHAAMALFMAGDVETANRVLDYLDKIQQRPDGSFPQNSWLNGVPYWGSIQMDEVADPIILAWFLGRIDLYYSMVKPAAEYILAHGPFTPQERWEENSGYSPASIAAQIAGLVCASEIAVDNGDFGAAQRYLDVADLWQANIDKWCYTTTGYYGDGEYYLRISTNGKPDTLDVIVISNGGGEFDQREIVDVSFLEMVRLGVKAADDPKILKTLKVVDDVLKVDTPKGPCWHRYNYDGYGETEDMKPYQGKGVGRLWPIFTGERGHYEILLGNDPNKYIKAMEKFANEGNMLSEQIYDNGEPTGSATPLAWSHAEYVLLLISSIQGKVCDMPSCVYKKYAGKEGSFFG